MRFNITRKDMKNGKIWMKDTDGNKYRFEYGHMPRLVINGGEKELTQGHDMTVYESSARKWNEDMETFFYPFCSESDLSLWNDVIAAVNAANN